MYAFMIGVIAAKETENIVLENNGIGYNIKISSGTSALLPPVGSNVKLYTYTSVREDAIQLYGFLSKDDLDIFKMLINVNGIGPKGGQSILSVMNADELRMAILSGDAKLIAKAPGIGVKTAQRVILDMKDKISLDDTIYAVNQDGNLNGHSHASGASKEAMEALVALGYGSTEAVRAVNSVNQRDGLSAEDILKNALRFLV